MNWSHPLPRPVLAFHLLGVIYCLPSCYEIPPRIPEDYHGGPVEPGWPPLAVYHDDPFHPANRLFHRLFILNAGPCGGDVPGLPRREFSAVDAAEIEALAIEVGGHLRFPASEDSLSERGLLLLGADLAWLIPLLKGIHQEAPGKIARALEAVREKLPECAAELPPPPPGAGIARDLGPLEPDHPRPAGSGLEAWLLEEARARIFHLRRAAWLRGNPPWEEVSPFTPITINAGGQPAGQDFQGTIQDLCRTCH